MAPYTSGDIRDGVAASTFDAFIPAPVRASESPGPSSREAVASAAERPGVSRNRNRHFRDSFRMLSSAHQHMSVLDVAAVHTEPMRPRAMTEATHTHVRDVMLPSHIDGSGRLVFSSRTPPRADSDDSAIAAIEVPDLSERHRELMRKEVGTHIYMYIYITRIYI